MDVGKIPINVYLDFSKAFDTLVHSTLLHKMKHYGIDRIAHKSTRITWKIKNSILSLIANVPK